MDIRPIGIFDSGVGGMTVLSEIAKALPNEKLIYLGDTKNFPYGDKSKQTILKISKNCIEFLLEKDVKMVVIACGTATSQSLEQMQKIFNIPIIGIINPTVEYISKNNENTNSKIGIIATEGTIRSNQWTQKLEQAKPGIQTISKACPLLAPMAEQGWTNNIVAKETIKEYMKPFKNQNINKLILGCTHYPLFKKLIQEELGSNVELINTGEKIAQYVKDYLKENSIQNDDNNPKHEYYLTDTECNFINVAKNILKDESITSKISRVEIEK